MTSREPTGEEVGGGDAVGVGQDEQAPGSRRKLGRRARRAASRPTGDASGPADAMTEDETAVDGSNETVVLTKSPGAVDASAPADEGPTEAEADSAQADSTATGASRRGKAKARKARVLKTKPGKPATGSKPGKGTGAAVAGRGRRLPRVIIALFVVAVLLAVTLLVQLIKGPGGSDLEAREDRREAARQAADLATARLFSFDYRKLDEDLNAQRAQTTGDFTREVEGLTGPSLRPVATKVQAVVQAVAVDSAVVEDGNGTGDVQVLVFLNQAVTTNVLAAPRLDRNRVVASMRQVDGQWKVAGIRAL